jgi:hypothetical protein
MDAKRQFTISLSSLIALIALGTAVVLLAAVLLIVKYESRAVALKSADILFREISEKIIAKTNVVIESFSTLTDVAALSFKAGHPTGAERNFVQETPAMMALLESKPQLMSAYIGYTDGAFHQLIAIRDDSFLLKQYEAPPGTAFIDRTISAAGGGSRRQRWRYLDPRETREAPGRTRRWSTTPGSGRGSKKPLKQDAACSQAHMCSAVPGFQD